jgi:hypothetical protein
MTASRDATDMLSRAGLLPLEGSAGRYYAMTPCRKSLASIIVRLVFGVCIGVAGCYTARHVLTPWRYVSDTEVRVYLSSDCRGCHVLFAAMNADPESWPNVVPLPLQHDGSEFSDQVCGQSLASVRGFGRLVANALPRRLTCTWLSADASEFLREQGHTAVPAFSVGTTALSLEQAAELLPRLGRSNG